jgi:hypothetical protein
MYRTLTLLALSGLVAACGSGQGGDVPSVGDQSPPLNGDAPANYSDTPATSDQAPLNNTDQAGMNEEAPTGGAIIGGCVGTTTPAQFLEIMANAICAQVPRCPAGPDEVSSWAAACDYLRDCASNPAQCDFSLEESIPVCPSGVESCLTAAFESLACDVTGDPFEAIDFNEIPECSGIVPETSVEQTPEGDPITDDINDGFGGAGG